MDFNALSLLYALVVECFKCYIQVLSLFKPKKHSFSSHSHSTFYSTNITITTLSFFPSYMIFFCFEQAQQGMVNLYFVWISYWDIGLVHSNKTNNNTSFFSVNVLILIWLSRANISNAISCFHSEVIVWWIEENAKVGFFSSYFIYFLPYETQMQLLTYCILKEVMLFLW